MRNKYYKKGHILGCQTCGECYGVLFGNTDIKDTNWKEYTFTANIAGDVRIRLRRTSGARMHLDDVAVSNYSTGVSDPATERHRWDAFSNQGVLTVTVSNPDGILSEGAVSRIDEVCAALRAKGLAQVAVVAVDDIESGDAFSFAIELFRRWGVGDARNDNGLGVLLVKDRHEIRFVTGGGLEGVLPDAICKRIQMQFMLPAFREDDFDRGMTEGIDAGGWWFLGKGRRSASRDFCIRR